MFLRRLGPDSRRWLAIVGTAPAASLCLPTGVRELCPRLCEARDGGSALRGHTRGAVPVHQPGTVEDTAGVRAGAGPSVGARLLSPARSIWFSRLVRIRPTKRTPLAIEDPGALRQLVRSYTVQLDSEDGERTNSLGLCNADGGLPPFVRI